LVLGDSKSKKRSPEFNILASELMISREAISLLFQSRRVVRFIPARSASFSLDSLAVFRIARTACQIELLAHSTPGSQSQIPRAKGHSYKQGINIAFASFLAVYIDAHGYPSGYEKTGDSTDAE